MSWATLREFLFGSGALDKAAKGPAAPAAPAPPASPSGIDVGALAQQQANRQLKQPPVPAPAAPLKKKKLPTVNGTVGNQLMEP